jgi:hypothetical protein
MRMADVDLTLETRRSIIAHLTPRVSGSGVYGEFTPANVPWPFIRYSSTTTPYEDSCHDGSVILVDLHVFANGPSTDSVLGLGKQVLAAMATWTDGEATWTGNIGPLADNPELSKWHLVVQYQVTTIL